MVAGKTEVSWHKGTLGDDDAMRSTRINQTGAALRRVQRR